jgi:hypothetical protein
MIPRTFELARLEIGDVGLTIFFAESGLDGESQEIRQHVYEVLRSEAALAGHSGEVSLVWKNESGRTKFIAPSQQHYFFLVVSYDQLYAQRDGSISCDC